jgi:toxin ParE1/3/4
VRRIRYHDEARLELLHEVGYYSAVSRRLGERFDLAVQAAVERAADTPELGAPYFDGTRRVFPHKFRFSIVYLLSEDELFVLAIAPFARKPGYWRKRRDVG